MAKNVTIVLKTDALENLAPIFNEQYMESLRRGARCSSTTFAVDLDALTDEELDKFVEWLQAKNARQAVIKVKSYIEVKNDSASAKIKGLQNFCMALKTEMSKLKNKWMFINADKTEEYLPYLILGVNYSEADGRGEYFEPAKVIIKGVYNGVSGYNTKNWVFYEEDIPGTFESFVNSYSS